MLNRASRDTWDWCSTASGRYQRVPDIKKLEQANIGRDASRCHCQLNKDDINLVLALTREGEARCLKRHREVKRSSLPLLVCVRRTVMPCVLARSRLSTTPPQLWPAAPYHRRTCNQRRRLREEDLYSEPVQTYRRTCQARKRGRRPPTAIAIPPRPPDRGQGRLKRSRCLREVELSKKVRN